ncbi:MAG: hypothetical protein JNG88_07715 [Phycisphaerales bacterium]|nr:hypothetical protein [Phycisphaerales bacterium]
MNTNDEASDTARTPNPLIPLFSSVRFGVVLLTLILIYASVGSALPQVRGAVEMTEMQLFSHWVFGLLIALFAITLSVTTWRRIRWNVTNLGVLIVHSGLLILTVGSFWYFGGKIEGDTFIEAPRIELVARNAGSARMPSILAEKGQVFSTSAPMLGGALKIEVIETNGDAMRPVTQAKVRVDMGAKSGEFALNEQSPAVSLSEQLSLQLRVSQPVNTFYDTDVPGLYLREAGQSTAARSFTAIRGLPLHRERFTPGGAEIRYTNGQAVKSHRTEPAVNFYGLNIPTGWFEHWRMPIAISLPDSVPFDATVSGYLPYVAETRMVATPTPGDPPNQAVEFDIKVDERVARQVLFARDPRDSIMLTAAPIEFHWVANDAEREALLKARAGAHELEIEVVDPPVKRTVAIKEGDRITVEGTPYVLTIQTISPSWPLMSPGYENAVTPAAAVAVSNGEKSYTRTVLQRFPALSQDIDEQGVRHREGPYDPNLVLRYRGSPEGWISLVASDDGKLELGFFDQEGKVTRAPLRVGDSNIVRIFGFPVDFRINGLHLSARKEQAPVVTPVELRRPGVMRNASMVRLDLRGRGEHANWSRTVWCPYSQFPHVDARPVEVSGPDGKEYEIMYSRMRRPLNGALALYRLEVEQLPGRGDPNAWKSVLRAKSDGAEAPNEALVFTNHTYSMGGWTFFQSGAPSNEPYWEWTILGVGNRYGVWPMTLGCTMIALGSLYAFYVKPIIRRRKAAAAMARVAERNEVMEPVAAEELAEVSR